MKRSTRRLLCAGLLTLLVLAASTGSGTSTPTTTDDSDSSTVDAEAQEREAVQELTPESRDRLRAMLARTSSDINEEWFALQDWGLA